MIRRPPRSTPLSLHDALPIYAATAVDHRSREQRWRDIHGHSAGGWRQRVARHAAACRECETRRWNVLIVRQPALHAHVGGAQGKPANAVDGMSGGLAE